MAEIIGNINGSGPKRRRPGGGRKPNYLKRLAKPITAALILAQIDEIRAWQELLAAESVVTYEGRVTERVPDLKIRMEALKYLTDRRDGKPRQSIEHSGDMRGLGFGSLPVPGEFTRTQPGVKPN